jgi:hypothetical protein
VASLLYKKFLVVAAADVEKATGKWIPIASVHWTNRSGHSCTHYITTLPERFADSGQAVDFGLLTAQQWVDALLAQRPDQTPRGLV